MTRFRFLMTMTIAMLICGVVNHSSLWAQPGAKKPIVERSPLLKEPKTPEEMFATTVLMVDLARLDLAVRYLAQFEASQPDDAMLLKLRDKHGTSDFLKLSSTVELQPRSTELLERLNAAARRQADDPVFVNTLIQRLIQGPPQQDMAMIELRNAGVRVVPEMIRQMSQPEMAVHQDTLTIALRRMGRQVIPPLIGAIDSPSERVQAAVIRSLGALDATEAIPYLWFPAFDEHLPSGVRLAAQTTLSNLLKATPKRPGQMSSVGAANELRNLARLLYRKPSLLPQDEAGSVNLWGWDPQEATVVSRALSPEIAALFLSTRFARQSLALSPDQPEPQRQYLASLLGLEVLRRGWDQSRIASPGSAMYLGLTAGEETLSNVLGESLEAGVPATSVAALELLGQVGTRAQLISQKGLKSPVLAALNSSDIRVQFAAATTVLKLEPTSSFSGSNRVVGILTRAVNDSGQSQAIVIDTDNRRASSTAAFLSDGGYAGVVAATGRAGFELAATSAGVELIAVHVNCQRWELRQTLTNLRADARTAAIPIVVYGPEELRGELARLISRNSPSVYVGESATSSDFLRQLLPFVKNIKTPPLSPAERDLQRNAAVYWLATIGSGTLARLFDISPAESALSMAVEDPNVAGNAITALAAIGTGSAQRRLTEVALNSQTSDNVRELAAGQMGYHIQRHGLLLTKEEVLNVHAGWKLAENPGVRSALAGVIGSLKPTPSIIGERLQQFPLPPTN